MSIQKVGPSSTRATFEEVFSGVQAPKEVEKIAKLIFNMENLDNLKNAVSANEDFTSNYYSFDLLTKRTSNVMVQPFFSKSERKQFIQKMVEMHPEAGSTLLFDLFSDHLFQLFKECLYHKEIRSLLRQKIIMVDKGNRLHVTLKDFLHHFVGDLYILLNVTSMSVHRLSKPTGLIETKPSPSYDIRGWIKNWLPTFKKHLIKLKGIEKWSPGRELIATSKLLVDLCFGDLKALAEPAAISYPENVGDVFQSMVKRLERCLYFINNFERFAYLPETVSDREDIKRALVKTRKEWIPVLTEVLSRAKQCLSSNSMSTISLFFYLSDISARLSESSLNSFTTDLSRALTPYIETFENGGQLVYSDERRLKEIDSIGITGSIHHSVDEGILACAVSLIQEGSLDCGLVSELLNDTKKIADLLVSYTPSLLNTKFEELERGGLAKKSGAQLLHQTWTAVKKYKSMVYDPLQYSLKNRLKALNNKRANVYEHACAFKSITHEFTIYVEGSISNLRGLERGLQIVGIDPELVDLTKELFNWLSLPIHSFLVMKRKALLLLVLLREKVQLEQERNATRAQEELLKIEKLQRARKTKRKQREQIEKASPKHVWREVEKPIPASEPFEELLEASPPELEFDLTKGIRSLKDLPLEGVDSEFRGHWRDASLRNLELIVSWLEESGQILSRDRYLQDIDLMRRILEAGIESVVALYPIHKNGKHILRSDRYRSHALHRLAAPFLRNENVPLNVRKVFYARRNIIYLLSQANACINYPYSSLRQIAHPYTQSLHAYFLKISAAKKPNPDLVKQHGQIIQMGRQFVEDLFHAALDSCFGCALEEVGEILSFELEGDMVFGEPKNLSEHQAIAGLAPGEEIHITSRPLAVTAIKNSLKWVELQLLAPPHGQIDRAFRKTLRDEALKNANLYLLRLLDKFNETNRLERLYDSVLGELSLGRRLIKEVTIGALLHGDYYVAGEHVVRAYGMRFENNPSLLNFMLRQYIKEVPDLSSFSWLKSLHRVVSYPHPLPIHSPKTLLDEPIARFFKLLGESTEEGFSRVKGKGAVTHEEHMKEVEGFIQSVEKQFVFPLIEATLQTLQRGFAV